MKAPHTIGFGIIGCGMIAEYHARAIAELHGAKLVAVASRTEANAKKFTGKFHTDYHLSTDELLARPDVHVVCVTTPSGAHMEPAVAAARARKHVVVEKPLDLTLARVDEIIAACKRYKVKLGAIFPARTGDGARLVKKTVASGRLGRLTMCDAYIKWWRSQQYYDEGGWKGTKRWDGGALMNQSIHEIDLLQWIAGMPVEVCAFSDILAHKRIECEDTAVAILRYKHGALGVIEGATSTYPGEPRRLTISGEHGTIEMEDDRISRWHFRDERPEDAEIRRKHVGGSIGKSGASDPKAISHEGHRRQLQDFVDAIRENREPMVPGSDGRNAVELILAIDKSAVTRRPVRLPLR